MAAKKLYGTLSCPATMRALASMFEHELNFEFIPVDLTGAGDHDVKKGPFLSLNPFGNGLLFQDGDSLTLFESRAIMRFISHQYPKPGKEQVFIVPKLQGIAATWIDVEDHQFDPPTSKLVMELVHKPKIGLPTNQAVVAEEEAKLAMVLDVYEERLTVSPYLGEIYWLDLLGLR
ncbi:GST_N_3 domain-containing protein [Cephalotus follicularis]|uniref:glutathione transferase n=1 Tax=Cephalotus follicularis TaxID=3775 RepID=A0A1Q3DAA4_CEPFO|nr:GST_N_3 domain-containing protein [Cephalotus follicularis]